MWNRKAFLSSLMVGGALLTNPTSAFSVPNPSRGVATTSTTATEPNTIAYRSLSLPMRPPFGDVNVPVACWYPTASLTESNNQPSSLTYPHRISVRRIGQMLAGWEFIPEFASRNFALPANVNCVNGETVALPSSPLPVVFLAHGYLGSRFDLCHLAEALASQGFLCVSPEYPESLAASYDRRDGLNRSSITQQLLSKLENDWKVQATSYGIVGHSLGCGTAVRTGDETWTRVCISGFPNVEIPGKVLVLTSMNDGVVSLARRGLSIPPDYILLDQDQIPTKIPARSALVYDGDSAPNHISFLAEGVNDAMVDFLSPLLPVAQALEIPVLDFDRYQRSRDSVATFDKVKPLVTQYLRQNMVMAPMTTS